MGNGKRLVQIAYLGPRRHWETGPEHRNAPRAQLLQEDEQPGETNFLTCGKEKGMLLEKTHEGGPRDPLKKV